MAKKYFVDPALVLGTAAESGFGQSRIFRDNKDAFGMSGGSLKTQPNFPSYEANVRQFFNEYGPKSGAMVVTPTLSSMLFPEKTQLALPFPDGRCTIAAIPMAGRK